MGFFNQGDGFSGMQDLLGGFGQSSMISRGPLWANQFQNCQLQQFATVSATTQALNYQIRVDPAIHRAIICPDCGEHREWKIDLDAFGSCSCGHREGSLTNAGWLESRIAEVVE